MGPLRLCALRLPRPFFGLCRRSYLARVAHRSQSQALCVERAARSASASARSIFPSARAAGGVDTNTLRWSIGVSPPALPLRSMRMREMLPEIVIVLDLGQGAGPPSMGSADEDDA